MSEINFFLKKKLLYLSNHSSSGNTFFLSLLDGHEQILNLPGYVDLNFIFENCSNFNYKNLFEKNNPFFFDTRKMNEKVNNHQGLYCLGKNFNQGIYLDKNKFNIYWDKFIYETSNSKRNILLGFYYAYAKTTKKNLNKIINILIYPYDHANTIKYIEILGSSKIFILSRNLFNNYYSYKKKQIIKNKIRNQHRQVYSKIEAEYVYNSSKNITPLLIKKLDFKIIRLEDLHNNPEVTLKKICKEFGIFYSRKLLTSSFLNKIYNGHSWSDLGCVLTKNYGFNPDYHKKSFSNDLDIREKAQILFIGYSYLKELNYITSKEIFFLLKNFYLIFFPNDFEKKFYFKNFDLKKIYMFFLIRVKFISVFIYQRLKIKNIKKNFIKF